VQVAQLAAVATQVVEVVKLENQPLEHEHATRVAIEFVPEQAYPAPHTTSWALSPAHVEPGGQVVQLAAVAEQVEDVLKLENQPAEQRQPAG